tara:strand:- start:2044 stop:2274 length:231 start_codon:yes stop_codon:yes gene_type:complete
MKIELTVNNRPFKESKLYNNLYTLLCVVIMVNMVVFDVLAIALLMKYKLISSWFMIYFAFTIFKGVFIVTKMCNPK